MSWHVRVRAEVGDLDMDIQMEGEADPVAIIGPNGSGKTTLLRMIAGARAPFAGDIEVDGQTFFSSRQDVDLPPEDRRVGYMPQGYGLFPHLNAVENVAFGLRSLSKENEHRRAREMLADLECDHLADRRPGALSGGESQRVALARALVIDPNILLLDEPLSALDAAARSRTRRLLARRLSRRDCPSVIVSHDVRDVRALDAYVYAIEGGQVAQRGPLEDLRAEPASAFVAEFVGDG